MHGNIFVYASQSIDLIQEVERKATVRHWFC